MSPLYVPSFGFLLRMASTKGLQEIEKKIFIGLSLCLFVPFAYFKGVTKEEDHCYHRPRDHLQRMPKHQTLENKTIIIFGSIDSTFKHIYRQ